MYQILSSTDMPIYLDSVATKFLNQARSFFIKKDLRDAMYINQGGQVTLLTWLGDNSNEALCCLLASQGIVATAYGPTIEIPKKALSTKQILSVLTKASLSEVPSFDVLLSKASNLQRAKWDWALPPSLLRKSYASLYLNVPEALEWASRLDNCKGLESKLR